MTRHLSVAAIQSAFGQDMKANLDKVEAFIRVAAAQNAQVVLPPELFQSIYFPTRQDPKWFELAKPVGEHPSVRALQKLEPGVSKPGERARSADGVKREWVLCVSSRFVLPE